MKITVTGATGFIGRTLIKNLLAGNHEVRALSRNSQQARRVLPVRCECEEWDPGQGPGPSVLRDSDAVIHLAGEGVANRRWTEDQKTAIRDSRVGTTRAIVRAIEGLPAEQRPRVLISASAIGIYGDRGEESLSEQSAPGAGFLADVCRAWEEEVFAAERLGLRVAAIRVGVVLGKQG